MIFAWTFIVFAPFWLMSQCHALARCLHFFFQSRIVSAVSSVGRQSILVHAVSSSRLIALATLSQARSSIDGRNRYLCLQSMHVSADNFRLLGDADRARAHGYGGGLMAYTVGAVDARDQNPAGIRRRREPGQKCGVLSNDRPDRSSNIICSTGRLPNSPWEGSETAATMLN